MSENKNNSMLNFNGIIKKRIEQNMVKPRAIVCITANEINQPNQKQILEKKTVYSDGITVPSDQKKKKNK